MLLFFMPAIKGVSEKKTDLERSAVLDESIILLKRIVSASDEDRQVIIDSINDEKLKRLISLLLSQVDKIDNGKEKLLSMVHDASWLSTIFSNGSDFVSYLQALPDEIGKLIVKTGILNFISRLKSDSGSSGSSVQKIKSSGAAKG